MEPTAKQDCNELFQDALPFAKRLLAELGAFDPFGRMLMLDGSIQVVSVCPDHPDARMSDCVAMLEQAFRERARKGELRATAIVYDALAAPSAAAERTDAIAVALDHRDGYSAIVYCPYRLTDTELVCGELFTQRGAGKIFATG